MVQWLSEFNYDFALAAIPIQIILMVFYCSRRNLPLRQSRSFLFVMISNLVMTVSDIAACELNELWRELPFWILYVINMLYFIAFIIRGWSLFDYCSEVCHIYRRTQKIGQILSSIPAIGLIIMILSTPWTKAIFYISPTEGYVNSFLYSSIYYCTWFYLLFSIVTVFICWDLINLRIKIGLFSYNAILIIGIILRRSFYHTLVTSYFSILAILVIYLTSQNPDLYRERETHLFNRAAFDVIGAEYLSKGIPFHCVILTAHNYETAKLIYGFNQLRRCLLLVGRWMVSHFKGYYVFYYGNGNYILFHRGTFEENREQTLKIISERFEKAWTDNDTDVSLSMSVMILPYDKMPNDINKIDDLLHYAFKRTYDENNLGNYVIQDEMLHSFDRMSEIESALGKALEENRLEVWFQPIYSTWEKRVVGAEALARLHDPELGFIPPSEFIEIAEQTGDIMEVGRQVFNRVCEFAQSFSMEELGLQFINVNLSPAQCLNEQLVSELSEIALVHNVSMRKFDFEITETSVSDYSMIKKQMLRLQDEGAELSLDDFGSGMSNLTSLMQLPIHIVKIDMEVVWAYFREETKVLPDLIRLFQNADMRIVVEGVETNEMKDVLSEMGCDYQQGYYFSKPLPSQDFLSYLNDSNASLCPPS
ncbi:MAG: EAL domain-containing protein [Parasporobacterium sp.]|nr:EAL domain-containing protein [Parasporobacterium sp.]